MDHSGQELEALDERNPKTLGRRPAIKTGIALAGGLVLANTYASPSLVSFGAQETYASSVNEDGGGDPGGCSPGFWPNNGARLWSTVDDPDWGKEGGLGTPPFGHTTLFNGFFTSHSDLNNWTMLQALSAGQGANWPQKAARDLVAGYLNASFGVTNYAYKIDQLTDMWNTAVSSGKFGDFHTAVDLANNACHKVPPAPVV